MALSVTKRLMGKEDVDFDTTGEGATNNFTNSEGVEKVLHKLNASHIPLTVALRAAFSGAVNIEEGLAAINTTLENFSDIQIMTQDTVIEFAADASISDMQTLIDQQIKNLGSHSLTFVFPAEINQSLVNRLSWSGFNNGTLIINGSLVTVADNADICSLFYFADCSCKVEVRNFTLQHTQSAYAIQAERCTEIYCDNCIFSGQAGSGSVAGNFICSCGIFNACTFTNDKESEATGFGTSTSIDEVLAYS